MHRKNVKDIAAGTFFLAAGLLYGLIAWFRLPIGVPLEMGPGYFPIVLSSVLGIFGILIIGSGIITSRETPFGLVPWRGVLLLSIATIAFAAFVDKLGMLPGIFVTTFVATLANPKITLFRAVLIALGVSIFCTAVFGYGVRLPIPIIGTWLRW